MKKTNKLPNIINDMYFIYFISKSLITTYYVILYITTAADR